MMWLFNKEIQHKFVFSSFLNQTVQAQNSSSSLTTLPKPDFQILGRGQPFMEVDMHLVSFNGWIPSCHAP